MSRRAAAAIWRWLTLGDIAEEQRLLWNPSLRELMGEPVSPFPTGGT